MNDPYPHLVRTVEPDVSAIEEAHERMSATLMVSTQFLSGRRCRHDTNWPRGQWCGETLTRHTDGGYWYCPAGHRFAF